ncbi:MAG: ABC transporter substrate-binding protein [Candidatus Riflebacteria bacterium]|nr:ABC transporter substrate-binding protein [Candidatus Riflebacteria bacterium]
MSSFRWAFGPVAVVLAGLALFVAGCGASRRTDERLTLAVNTEPSSLDPALSKDVPSGRLVGYVYSTLVRFDENLALVGDLSDTFVVSPDGKTYTFHIRANARFASGRPITAEDAKASFERVLDPKVASPRTWLFDRIEGAREFMDGKAAAVTGIAAKGASLVITLKDPFAPFMGLLSMPSASIVDKEEIRKWGRDFPLHDSGSGPFTVLSWVKDSGLELSPNPYYHEGASRLRGLSVRILREPLTIVTELGRGNVDIADIPASQHAGVSSDPRWTGCVLERPGLNVYYLGLNCQRGPFSNVALRQAAAHAIDRERIVSFVRKGQAVPAVGPIPPGLLGHDPSFSGLRVDKTLAKQLAARAGLKAGTAIRLLQSDDKSNLEVTQMIQAYLQELGFDVKLVSYESSTFKKRVDEGDFDAFYYSWFADYPDAENFLYPLFHSSRAGGGGNGPRYADPIVDDLLAQAHRTADDRARQGLYRKIEEKVVADASRVYLFHRKTVTLRQPWVTGYRQYPVFNCDRLSGVSLDLTRLGQF